MLDAVLFTSEDELTQLRHIVTFYRCVDGNSVPIKSIDMSKIEAIRFPQIRTQLIPVLKKSERFDFEQTKQQVVRYLTETLFPTERMIIFLWKHLIGESTNRNCFSRIALFCNA